MDNKNLAIPGFGLLPKFQVTLKGFWNEDIYILTLPCRSRSQAAKITGAIYGDCYKRADVKEVV